MPLRRAVSVLDRESVRPFQVLVYCAYIGAGVHAVCEGNLPTTVAQILGPAAHVGWVGLLIVCPLLTFVGMVFEARSPAGLLLQLAGDTGVAVASAVYGAARARAAWAGGATFALWVVLALGLCAIALVVRGVRKIRAIGRVVRSMDRDK